MEPKTNKRHKWQHLGPGPVDICDNCGCIRKGRYPNIEYFPVDVGPVPMPFSPPCSYIGLSVDSAGSIELHQRRGGNPNQLKLF